MKGVLLAIAGAVCLPHQLILKLVALIQNPPTPRPLPSPQVCYNDLLTSPEACGLEHEAEQLRLLCPQREDALDQRTVVALTRAGPRQIGAVEPLAQLATRTVLQEGSIAREVERHSPGSSRR